jgi:hypothetical protein
LALERRAARGEKAENNMSESFAEEDNISNEDDPG